MAQRTVTGRADAGRVRRRARYLEADMLRVLIVDDDPFSATYVSALVRSMGAPVELTVVSGPMQALEACQAKMHDVVLADYVMPFLNGMELVRMLRKEPGYEAVPVLMLTGSDYAKVEEEAREAGATELLHKPLDAAQFKRRFAEITGLATAA